MKHAICLTLVSMIAIATSSLAAEQNSRYVVENGVTYLETRVVERRPKADVRMEERTETVYKPQFVTEFRDEVKTHWVPVTEYVYTPRWHNRWNPFVQPTLTYEYQPVTRWQLRTETTRVPMTAQKLVPETKIVRAPVRILGFTAQEQVQRVAVQQPAAAGTSVSNIASQPLSPVKSAGNLPRPWAAPENSPSLRR